MLRMQAKEVIQLAAYRRTPLETLIRELSSGLQHFLTRSRTDGRQPSVADACCVRGGGFLRAVAFNTNCTIQIVAVTMLLLLPHRLHIPSAANRHHVST
jgi:hypothetical protein